MDSSSLTMSATSGLPGSPGWAPLHDNAAISGGKPARSGGLGSAPIPSGVRMNGNGLW
jgi:hypothetical protein